MGVQGDEISSNIIPSFWLGTCSSTLVWYYYCWESEEPETDEKHQETEDAKENEL